MHVVETLDPAAGGLPAVPVRLACAAARAGRAVGVASPDVGQHREPYQSIAGADEVDWLPLDRDAVGRWLDDGGGGETSNSALHCHGVWSPALLPVAAMARRRSVPVVVTPHGMLDPWSLRQSRWKKRVALATTHRRYLRGASALHCLNETEAAGVAELGSMPPVHVIGNGVDLAEIDAAAGRSEPGHLYRSSFGEVHGPVVLFLGRLHSKKRPEWAAAAMDRLASRHPTACLAVVGPDDGQAAEVRRIAAAGRWTDRLWMPGPLYGDDKVAALRDAAVFVLPSQQEGFSLAVLEAMASRTAVLLSPGVHFDEVQPAGAGRVVAERIEDWSEAIGAVLHDAEEAAAMGERGRCLVQEHYTWDAIGEQLEKLYQSL